MVGPGTDQASGGAEIYTQRDNPDFEAQMAGRAAVREAGFFLRRLRPGMRVLDVGCGPGSITVGLAQAVAPGEVIGVDRQSTQVERARALAAEQLVTNTHFEVADVYALPFADGSFDAVLAHVVLMHLSDPVSALREMRRVLRSEGIVGVRDPDFGAAITTPLTSLRERYRELAHRVRRHNGGDPFLARQHRRLLRDAGFAQTEGSASVTSAGSQAECQQWAVFLKAQLAGIARTALAEGWVDEETVDAIAKDIEAWAECPDAFSATLFCETIGWVSAGR